MSVKLYRLPKPEESQKNSNFNGKTIPFPGFEPSTSRLAVGRHNHCTIGSVLDIEIRNFNKNSGTVSQHNIFLASNDF
jgi:hypothetical protein